MYENLCKNFILQSTMYLPYMLTLNNIWVAKPPSWTSIQLQLPIGTPVQHARTHARLPELRGIHANSLHVQVEECTLQLLPSGQHVEEALHAQTIQNKPNFKSSLLIRSLIFIYLEGL